MLKIKKGKIVGWLLLPLLIVVCLIYVLPWSQTFQAGRATTSLSIAFEGAGNGLDPQGNRFDINEIKNPEIIEKAIKAAGLEDKTTIDEVKTQIYVLPRVQADTLRELLTLTTIDGKTQKIGEQLVYPTTFTIGLKDSGFPSVFSQKKLLKEITNAYQDHLKSKYLSDTAAEPAYTREEILNLDYPEMVKVLEQEADSLVRYIDVYAKADPRFVSEKSGLSFGDLAEKAQLIKKNDVGNLKSLVGYYSLTKEPENRSNYEQTLLRRAGVVAAKLEGAKATASDIVAIYDNNSNYVFASQDTGSVDVTPTENEFFSNLMQALVDKQTAYIGAKYDEQDIARAIEKLQLLQISPEQYEKTAKRVNSGVKDTLVSIDELKESAKGMAHENYEENIGNKINVGSVSYIFNSYGNPVILYLLLLGMLLLGYLVKNHFFGSENGLSLRTVVTWTRDKTSRYTKALSLRKQESSEDE